ncbi:MAG: hypothetical protein H7Y37_11565 [Anaerolineae bacterium]|nr:hypothetical protein [Gloeobacterales cyanobacterium ES-bin-313]
MIAAERRTDSLVSFKIKTSTGNLTEVRTHHYSSIQAATQIKCHCPKFAFSLYPPKERTPSEETRKLALRLEEELYHVVQDLLKQVSFKIERHLLRIQFVLRKYY